MAKPALRAAQELAPPSDLTARINAAQKGLTAAKKSGEAAAIASATAALEAAKGALEAAHKARFEGQAQRLGKTAARAMLELARLCDHRRYRVTATHATAILACVDGARAELANALEAAATRKAPATPIAPVISFGEAAHVS
jgi:hypothetical protein